MTYKKPTPKKELYDLYWRFAAERQAILDRRLQGEAYPWTEDPILQEYKFCNAYRAADRISQYLIRDIQYAGSDVPLEDLVFQTIAFRFFSKSETWEHLKNYLGVMPSIHHLESGQFEKALQSARDNLGVIYTSAFILCANDAFKKDQKHLNHVALFEKMFVTDKVQHKILAAESLEEVFNILRTYPLIGNFMAYQLAIDLNYSRAVNFSENDFVKAGPGALRGIQKVFSDLGTYTPEDVIMMMVENQEREFKRLSLNFDGLQGRPLHAIDCQNLFCEFDKYLRVKRPEIKSARSRIKTRYKKGEEVKSLFFPPKWSS